jgi:hypothetical protein
MNIALDEDELLTLITALTSYGQQVATQSQATDWTAWNRVEALRQRLVRTMAPQQTATTR